MDIQKLIAQTKTIALDAGTAIMDIYNNEADFGVEIKGDNSPLTKADKAANDIIVAGLKAISDFPIISEEDKLQEYAERKGYDYFWLVDPLDGTKEFIKRNGEFTVNIALGKGTEMIAGVVYAPSLNQLFWGIKGGEAAWEKEGTIAALQPNTFSMQDEGLNVVCSRSHLNEATQNFLDQLNKPNTVATGSSLKIMLLASGQAQVYPRLGPTMEWDTAAAQAVLEAAGGTLINEETGKALEYNKENLLNPYFVAYAKRED